ncbi:amidohydrolase [Sporobolomyces koalae]|uniref:amidohydrolase n=1 Tax=Sporobolomyces koalae TaxID=500713 RepID=UPI00317F5F22
MALRRRKPPATTDELSEPQPQRAPVPARKKKPISPTSTPQSRRRTIPPRLRSLIFFSPLVLIGWYLLSRSHAPRALGRQYAVCSRSSDGIITMNPHEFRTQCLVVSDSKIVATGTIDDIREQFGDKDTFGNDGIRIRWLNPRETVLPGLIDAHAHMLQYGESQSAVNLVGATSMAEVRERIARFIDNSPALAANTSRFILGLGWDQTKFVDLPQGQGFPAAADLDVDPRLEGRPIYLKRIDVHALWVSTRILDLMPRSLPEVVPGGMIVRYPDTERPTGIFLDNAMSLVTRVIPPWTDNLRLEYLKTTSRQMLKHGLTAVHDAALSLEDIRFLKELDREDLLPIRVYGMLSCENPLNSFCGDEPNSDKYLGNKFDLRAVKLFVDGALGSFGSAMHEPYSDNPDSKGILICPKDELDRVVKQWVAKGYQVNSHGIGDLANTLILEAYSSVLANASSESSDWTRRNPLRLRIEHAQILRVEDIQLMGKLGVVASFQPTHATSDMDYVESRIGPERVQGAYAWRKIIDSGAPYVLGSDFPVESVDPFYGIFAAITREYNPVLNPNRTGSPHGPDRAWFKDERLSAIEALQGFTTRAAQGAFWEHRVGQLRIGFEADFIVVEDGDVLELGQERTGETLADRRERHLRLATAGERVKATVVAGKLAYGSF